MDLALRPGEALPQGGLRNEERPRDLAGRQSGDRPQRQRDPSVHRERRVATGEQEPETIVRDLVHVDSDRLELGDLRGGLGLRPADAVAAELVDRAVASRGDDPGLRVVRHPAAGPRTERDLERVLDRLLRQVEVARDADQGSHRPPGALPERPLEGSERVGHPSMMGRTSTEPCRAPGILLASSIAVSRSSTSTRK